MKVPFNKPFFIGNELKYISQAVKSRKISGDRLFTKKCHDFFEEKYGFKKVLLTNSCTAALEMAAILNDTKEGFQAENVSSNLFLKMIKALMLVFMF